MANHITTPPSMAWAQVTDDALQCSLDNTTMTRTYKLPTSCCTNIINSLKLNYSVDLVESWIETVAGDIDVGVTGAKFTPATDNTWGLKKYQLQQIEAGQYMVLKCWFEYTGVDIDAAAEEEDWSEDTQVSQNVSWQTYSVSPYIYCNEVDHTDTVVPATGTTPTLQGGNALRRHIELALTQNAQDTSNNPFIWQNANKAYQLTLSESKIWKKVAAGVNPVFHKPIVVVTNSFKTMTSSSVPHNNRQIDRINAPPVDVPEWSGDFIYTGRSWSKSQQTYYTSQHPEGVTIYTVSYTDTWEGALDPDTDFYGTNAWEFHKGPDNGGN